MHRRILTLVTLFAAALAVSPADAAFTYSEGMVFIKLLKFESRGVIFDSWEGEGEITAFDKSEKCEEAQDQCYTAKKEKIAFSVRPETQGGAVANAMRKAIGQEMLVKYRIHKFTAAALSSDFEITEILTVGDTPIDFPTQQLAPKTGSKRNFSVRGRIIQFEYRGTVKGTYEGLYVDKDKNKVHPFSVTNEEMADYVQKAM
ncbi:MAG: hypothetical protein HY042_01295, partial [Spirochaetia bacterium]|nr:hypothetical protein [Spirochaetia bacterium]